jgi:hypothetical protein
LSLGTKTRVAGLTNTAVEETPDSIGVFGWPSSCIVSISFRKHFRAAKV